MRRGRRIQLGVLLVLALAAGLLAGCGGGSGTSKTSASSASTTSGSQGSSQANSTPAPLSSAELIARADPICRRVNAEIAASKPKSASPAEILRVVPGNAALEKRAVAALQRLKPPRALTGDWTTILADRRMLAEQLVELVGAAQKNDVTTLHKLAQSKARLHKSLEAAGRRVGFVYCGEVGLPKPSAPKGASKA